MSRLIAFLFLLAFSITTAYAQPLNKATAAVNLKTAQDQEDKQLTVLSPKEPSPPSQSSSQSTIDKESK